MKLKNLLIILVISLFFITSCSSFFVIGRIGQDVNNDENLPCKINCEPKYRNGGVCNDGTKVNGNGEGQCKHNGGVKCWYCSD
jgi:hypothetical protein